MPFTVVGVTPARFTGLEVGQSFDVALPVCSAALWSDSLDRRDLWWLTVMGRLKPDWTIARADTYLRTLSPGLLDATVPPGYGADLIAQYRALPLRRHSRRDAASAACERRTARRSRCCSG